MLYLSLVLLLSPWGFAAGMTAEKPVYSVGIVPQVDARRLHDIWRPILDELGSRLGAVFVLRGSPSIPAFEKAFMAGAFDFAYMNPYHALLAHTRQGYQPLIRDVGHALAGVLVVRKDTGITQVAQLANQEIAFPAPNALAASLMIRADLSDKFNIRFTPRYVRSHSSVYLNVVLGKMPAGGGVEKTLQQQAPQIRQGLRILYRTDSIAPHPIVAHPRVPQKVREQVREALLALGKTAGGKQLLARVPIRKAGLANIKDYQPLSRMKLERLLVRNW